MIEQPQLADQRTVDAMDGGVEQETGDDWHLDLPFRGVRQAGRQAGICVLAANRTRIIHGNWFAYSSRRVATVAPLKHF